MAADGIDVLGLGTLATDVLIRVDKLPAADGFCVVKSSTHQPGGSGTNVIVQLARLGDTCAYVGKIGDDPLGAAVLDSLGSEGVDTASMVVAAGGETLHTDVVIADNGEKFIMLNLGDAFASLACSEASLDRVRSARVLYTDLLPKDPALAALTTAREAGVTTVVNVQVDLTTMWGFGFETDDILAALPLIDVFAPCRNALFALCDSEDPIACATHLRRHGAAGTLLFTLGSTGSVAFAPTSDGSVGERVDMPALPVEVVDTTGAGDSYLGGFTHAYCLEGKGLRDAMAFATVCAAHTVGGLGARSTPTLAQVQAEMAARRATGLAAG